MGLVQKTFSMQDGTLQKSLKNVAKTADDAVANHAAVKALSRSQTDDLDAIVDQLSDESAVQKLESSQDITAEFLQIKSYQGPKVCKSKFFVYRGLVQTLFARHHQDLVGSVAVLAGNDDNVLEACITRDLKDALSCEELAARWKECKYQILGIAAWETAACSCQQFMEHMASLLSLQQDRHFLLLVLDSHGHVSSWDFNTTDNPGDFVRVDLDNHRKNRRAGQTFKIFNLDQAGSNIYQQQAGEQIEYFCCTSLPYI